MHQTHFCKKGEEKRGHAPRALFFCTLRPARLVSPRCPVLPCPAPATSLAPMLAAAGDKILHGFYKTDTLDLTLTCYDGIGQECVKYENE
jgi:hypothetical protein